MNSSLVLACAFVLALGVVGVKSSGAAAADNTPAKQQTYTTLPIRVNNPRRLGAWQLPAERVVLGEAYKPSMAMLPDGELVMVALFQDTSVGAGKIREWTGLWRSGDGGRSWSERVEIKDMIGREQWLTCTRGGTLFATCHLLANDVNNPDSYTHSYLHRSGDGGRRWQRTRIGPDGFPSRASTTLSRGVVELPDGTLLLGVGVNELEAGTIAYVWKSRDGGKTWDQSRPRVTMGGYQGRPYHNWDGFFSEDFTFPAKSGKLLHFIRCGPPALMYPMNDGRAVPVGDDGIDRMMRCESTDGGQTWSDMRDHGDYGMHYPRVIHLRDGRLLMTFTQRSTFYPIGLQAVLSDDDGETWDFIHDRIIIEGKTPWGMAQGGGFGNTLQLKDDTLVSCYTYRGADDKTHLEVVRWRLGE
ncbi:MAG: exo-alpha-sialidase [Planctomycetes bacterium]|nr:exo-alpha-sialidase [Planctomycetota bacterium]